MNKLITVKELAAILGVEISTIYDWTYRRRIEYVKVGKLLRFSPEAVEKFISSNTKRGF